MAQLKHFNNEIGNIKVIECNFSANLIHVVEFTVEIVFDVNIRRITSLCCCHPILSIKTCEVIKHSISSRMWTIILFLTIIKYQDITKVEWFFVFHLIDCYELWLFAYVKWISLIIVVCLNGGHDLWSQINWINWIISCSEIFNRSQSCKRSVRFFLLRRVYVKPCSR